MRKFIVIITFLLGAVQLQAQCVANLSLTTFETVTPVLHEASNSVVASSGYGLSPGYNSTLRAGVLVELKGNTHIKSGSLFLAKIGPCGKKARQMEMSDKLSAAQQLTVYPNPVTSKMSLSVDNMEMSTVTLASIDGKIISVKDVKNETSLEMEMDHYPSGIYLLTVETVNGQVFRNKIVKN
ncbi:T9SS type A sorting domain-containing protein [Flavobacterium microcysteis]